jgi:hypothetical protein
VRSGRKAARIAATRSVVPTGTVLSTTTSEPGASTDATARVAASTKERSGRACSPWPSSGVGTAMTTASAGSGAAAARSLPPSTIRRTSASRSGSPKCARPRLIVSTTRGLVSTPSTSTPFPANTAAVGRPT